MPRALRIQEAGHLHHVICRGNDRQSLFNSPKDNFQYLAFLEEARSKYPVKIYNFVLMDNHVHMLIEPKEDGNLAKAMEHLSKNYAKYFNKTYNRVGHVFQGRYKAFLVQQERYFFACTSYIDLNPVKANIVQDPKDYKWSAYRRLAYGHKAEFEIDLHDLYLNIGKTDQERQIGYRTLVLNNPAINELNLLDRRVCILGDDEFKQTI